MTSNKQMLVLANEYALKRSKIQNSNNGYAYMSCLIIGKTNKYVL